ncbi:hypothetical protein [Streptomyces sp. SAS_275]|uniref:hypothetical protein n=1 Tax=Streptomyces sp. SAS_275 TaxID=3412746 RepID=UPI00403C2479
MAEMAYPYYRIQADGPNETAITLTLRVDAGVGGPLPGLTEQKVLDGVRALLAGEDVSVRAAHYDLTITDV